MKKDLKSLAGLLLGAFLSYFIVRLLFNGDESVIYTTIGVAVGMVITYAAIIGFKKEAGKYDEQE